MIVDDSGLEVIRKSAVEVTPGDSSAYKIRVDANVTTSIDTTGLATDAKQDDQTALLTQIAEQQTDGSQHVIVDSAPPVTVDTTGLATDTKQDVGNASLASIDSKITDPLPVSPPNNTAVGSFTAPGEQVISCAGMGSVWVHVGGTWVGGASFFGSMVASPSDPSDWFTIYAMNIDALDSNVFSSFDNAIYGTETDFQLNVAGLKWFKLAATAIDSGEMKFQIGASQAAAIMGGMMSIIYVGQANAPWQVQTV